MQRRSSGILLPVSALPGPYGIGTLGKAAYEFADCDQLELAYAVTVHKSQGSEFDIVLLVLSQITPLLQYRNLLYTAVTRAKQVLIIVGNDKVLYNMVDNSKKSNRYSGLRHMLTTFSEYKDDAQ